MFGLIWEQEPQLEMLDDLLVLLAQVVLVDHLVQAVHLLHHNKNKYLGSNERSMMEIKKNG
jgi:hypothetical protein